MSSGASPAGSAAPFVPASRSLRTLRRAVQECRGCPLYANATQAVFGEGPARAAIVLVGEQPGDHEDQEGHPFVGPAGGVLWRCIDDAGIRRDDVFVTNAVKHFKHERRGARRLHKRPTSEEVAACHPWIEAELRAVGGRVIVALGATAARSLFGRVMPIGASRGTTHHVGDRPTIVTYHPSAVLRARDAAAEIQQALVDDLRRARGLATTER